jgi:hypothetical protein
MHKQIQTVGFTIELGKEDEYGNDKENSMDI